MDRHTKKNTDLIAHYLVTLLSKVDQDWTLGGKLVYKTCFVRRSNHNASIQYNIASD